MRLLAGAVAASFAAGGAALVFEPGNVVALVVGGSLVLGAATYVAGLVRLVGGKGYELRAAGWLLLSAPLLIPSTLTLALPVAALLVIPVPGNETRGAERPRAGGHRPPGQRIPARPIDER